MPYVCNLQQVFTDAVGRSQWAQKQVRCLTEYALFGGTGDVVGMRRVYSLYIIISPFIYLIITKVFPYLYT